MMKKSGFVENDNITLLAKGVLLRGEIRVEGTVRIDGRLEGDLHTTGTIVIGEDGIVHHQQWKDQGDGAGDGTAPITQDRSARRRSPRARLLHGRRGEVSRDVGYGRCLLG